MLYRKDGKMFKIIRMRCYAFTGPNDLEKPLYFECEKGLDSNFECDTGEENRK